MEQRQFDEARRLEASGRHREARTLYRCLTGAAPAHAELLASIGRCSLAMAEHADAERAFASASRLEPANPDHRSNRAYALSCQGRAAEARDEAHAALALRPDHPAALRVLAETWRNSGETRRAYETLKPVIDADASAARDPLMRIYFAKLAGSVGLEGEAIDMLTALDASAHLPGPIRAALHFELGAILDRVGRYEDAWRSIDLANHEQGAAFDIDALAAHVDELIGAWTPERLAALPRARVLSDLPVFIVGMPRSGSTLLEQILAGHPSIASGGERPDIPLAVRDLMPVPRGVPSSNHTLAEQIERLRGPSLDRLARRIAKSMVAVDPHATRVTDKHLHNFLNVPIIRLLFPGAPIIHTRRDPIDTCLSCYFQNFTNGLEFTYDLETLALYYKQYDRLMRHWRSLFPDDLIELRYEDLVSDLGGQARRIVAALSLGWDDACLRFHERKNAVATVSAEQVRRPIFKTSIGRSRHYSKHLRPLTRVLAR